MSKRHECQLAGREKEILISFITLPELKFDISNISDGTIGEDFYHLTFAETCNTYLPITNGMYHNIINLISETKIA